MFVCLLHAERHRGGDPGGRGDDQGGDRRGSDGEVQQGAAVGGLQEHHQGRHAGMQDLH